MLNVPSRLVSKCGRAVLCGVLILVFSSSPVFAAQKRPQTKKPAAKHAVAKKPAAPALDEQALQTQVMLDRAWVQPLRHVTREHLEQINRRHAGDHTGEVGIHAGNRRGDVRAERDAVERDRPPAL